MLTIKNRSGRRLVSGLILAGLLAGCTPAGPRALLEGKRLLDAGDATNAIVRLQIAVTLLPTNAVALNYLGLACHRAGQFTNAALAYQKALTLHPDLLEARFNLGCLWLEQNRYEPAKAAFTAYTLRRPNEPEAWLKLGLAQLHLRDAGAAEKSYSEALRLNPKNAQAFNGLGLAALQRNRPRDAAQHFAAAAQMQPAFGPARLNLAITLHQHLKDKPQALQRYRDYLALTPRPANWEAANATARELEQELARAAAPPATNTPAQSSPPGAATAKPTTNAFRPPVIAKSDPATNVAKPMPAVVTKPVPPPATHTVQVTAPLEVKPAQDIQPPAASRPLLQTSAPPSGVQVTTNRPQPKPEPAKRTFLQRVNPVNLFRRGSKPRSEPTPLPVEGKQTQPPPSTNLVVTSPPPVPPPGKAEAASVVPATKPIPRYAYRSPVKPEAGNRAEAERSFNEGGQAHRQGRLTDAMQAYRAATTADPAYFEAYYNLGLACLQAGRFAESLAAYEDALALMADSRDARYNFALALKEGGYLVDAAGELEQLVSRHTNDTRARLALANLYAQQLRQPAKAREHYNKVLEIEPRHPQADAIRRWLVQNPG